MLTLFPFFRRRIARFTFGEKVTLFASLPFLGLPIRMYVCKLLALPPIPLLRCDYDDDDDDDES